MDWFNYRGRMIGVMEKGQDAESCDQDIFSDPTICMTLGKSFDFNMLQFPHL